MYRYEVDTAGLGSGGEERSALRKVPSEGVLLVEHEQQYKQHKQQQQQGLGPRGRGVTASSPVASDIVWVPTTCGSLFCSKFPGMKRGIDILVKRLLAVSQRFMATVYG